MCGHTGCARIYIFIFCFGLIPCNVHIHNFFFSYFLYHLVVSSHVPSTFLAYMTGDHIDPLTHPSPIPFHNLTPSSTLVYILYTQTQNHTRHVKSSGEKTGLLSVVHTKSHVHI